MKRPPVVILRRIVLAALVVVVTILLGNYGLRRWRAQQARESLPASVPGDVRQQAERFTFSRSEGGQTLFNVEARRTTERAGQTTVLENVVVTIYGARGERADEIRTARCEYDVEGTGQILCPGEVTVHLRGGKEGAADTARAVRLTTSAVRFDPATSVAWTDQPVRFTFPKGSGEAVGLRYQAQEPAFELQKQVSIQVTGDAEPTRITGAALRFFAREHAFELVAPLEITAVSDQIIADRIRMEVGPDFKTRRIDASGNVRVRGLLRGRPLAARAAQAVADYASDGRMERLRATGQVFIEQPAAAGAASKEELSCAEAVFVFDSAHRQVERVAATGGARLLSTAAQQTRELRAPSLELRLRGAEQTLTTRPGSGAASRPALVIRKQAEEQTILADQIELQFENQERLRALTAAGSVEMKQARPTQPAQTTSSDTLNARFDASGRLAEAEQRGNFRYQSAWKAEAGRATYSASTGLYVLRESPAVWDSATRTSAREIQLDDRTGLFRGEGEVRTTYNASADGPGFGSGEPAHLSGERLLAERASGRATYHGQARLWQGENRLAADTIDLYRSPKRLVAEGNVSGVFVDTQKAVEPGQQRQTVTVASDHFTFTEADRRGLFEGNVTARNGFGELSAPELEVLFARTDAGNSELRRALARGGVKIQQGASQALGEQAEYSAAEQTVTLWGGEPRLIDPTRGTTEGDRLTLFLPDGRIRVDSAEGTRTVTRRPWTR